MIFGVKENSSFTRKANVFFPIVFEQGLKGERSYDIPSRLLKDRIILLNDVIDNWAAASICSQLLFLDKEDKTKPISIYIMSPGGYCDAGLAIYDTMQMVQAPVRTICLGEACSMASILLAGGVEKGRGILPHGKVMIHLPRGGVSGDNRDIQIAAAEYQDCTEKLAKILAKHTGKEAAQIVKDMDRDMWFSAEEAIKYGLVDSIIKSTPK
jgi:ATP-dependent Clp protease protease subunit